MAIKGSGRRFAPARARALDFGQAVARGPVAKEQAAALNRRAVRRRSTRKKSSFSPAACPRPLVRSQVSVGIGFELAPRKAAISRPGPTPSWFLKKAVGGGLAKRLRRFPGVDDQARGAGRAAAWKGRRPMPAWKPPMTIDNHVFIVGLPVGGVRRNGG